MSRIPQGVLRARRDVFLEGLGDGVAVIPTARLMRRNGDVKHVFRPSSDFYYLTGFGEPGAVAVISRDDDASFRLFVRPKDPAVERWTGRRAGVEGALADHGADEAYPIDELADRLPALLENRPVLGYGYGRDDTDDQVNTALERVRGRIREGVRAPDATVDPASVLAEMRLIKGPEEVDLLRSAVEITREGHLAAMAASKPGGFEYEVEAELTGPFRRLGGTGLGYTPIVAAGENACILHYIENSGPLEAGRLLLVDAGSEVDCYTADVTRTWPVDGTFTEVQRELYSIVLEANLAAISAIRPGALFSDVHHAALRVLVAGMCDLGLIEGPPDEAEREARYRQHFMHRTSHWLGMDVHDCGSYERDGDSRCLEAGMVLTVEPGLYLDADAAVPEGLHGTGIRIEDDVLVTDSGADVLSAGIPKLIDEVETACSA